MFQDAWPTIMYFSMWDDHENYSDMIKEIIYEDSLKYDTELATDIGIRIKSNLKESSLSFFKENSNDYRLVDLVLWIEENIRYYYDTLKNRFGSVLEKSTKIESYKINFRDSWYHITKNKGYHDMHTHGNSSVCGIYYVDVGNSNMNDANGINRFRAPFYPQTDDLDRGYSWYPSDIIDVEPQNGKLILFPGYLLHSATPYFGDDDRIVIAFNAQIHKESESYKPTLSGLFDMFNTIGNQQENLFDENS